MQPTYLPWAGYFNLMAQSQHFVILDDVQYERGSWQNRNRVLVQDQVHWLTVPAQRETLSSPILEVRVDDHVPWRRKHIRTLQQAYARHPHGAEMIEVARRIEDPANQLLCELNGALIAEIAARLELDTRVWRASALGVSGGRSERLRRICERLGCGEYLSPLGSADYLAEDGAFGESGVRLRLQDFVPAPYPQKGAGSFHSHLSIMDVAANIGWMAARDYVRGTFPPRRVE